MNDANNDNKLNNELKITENLNKKLNNDENTKSETKDSGSPEKKVIKVKKSQVKPLNYINSKSWENKKGKQISSLIQRFRSCPPRKREDRCFEYGTQRQFWWQKENAERDVGMYPSNEKDSHDHCSHNLYSDSTDQNYKNNLKCKHHERCNSCLKKSPYENQYQKSEKGQYYSNNLINSDNYEKCENSNDESLNLSNLIDDISTQKITQPTSSQIYSNDHINNELDISAQNLYNRVKYLLSEHSTNISSSLELSASSTESLDWNFLNSYKNFENQDEKNISKKKEDKDMVALDSDENCSENQKPEKLISHKTHEIQANLDHQANNVEIQTEKNITENPDYEENPKGINSDNSVNFIEQRCRTMDSNISEQIQVKISDNELGNNAEIQTEMNQVVNESEQTDQDLNLLGNQTVMDNKQSQTFNPNIQEAFEDVEFSDDEYMEDQVIRMLHSRLKRCQKVLREKL